MTTSLQWNNYGQDVYMKYISVSLTLALMTMYNTVVQSGIVFKTGMDLEANIKIWKSSWINTMNFGATFRMTSFALEKLWPIHVHERYFDEFYLSYYDPTHVVQSIFDIEMSMGLDVKREGMEK